MPQIFVNNGRARLTAAISSSATTIGLTDIVGLPTSLASGDWFLLSISRNDSRYGSNHEVVRVTGISGSNYTVVRGYEGAAVAHDVNEVVEARSTADTHTRMLREAVWAHVSDKPATATRWPAWDEVTAKPGAFTPVAHTHPWAEVTGAPATATRWPAWGEVTGKPTTFAPSTHSHVWSQIVEPPETATRWPAWDEVADKPLTTDSRTNSSTSTLLQAKAMNDHRQSGDHDGRYHTKTEADARYALLGSANTLTQDLTISRPSAATAGLTLTGGRTGDAGAVASISLVNAQDSNTTGSVQAWRRAAGTLDLEILGFAKTKLASAVEIANSLTLAGSGYQAVDLRSALTTGALGGIRWYHTNSTLAGELRFTAAGGVEAAQGAQFTGNGAGLTNLSAGALASGTVPAGRLSGSYTMNASTASALETSRTINGTGFNGTANITTSLWGTARTFTIGSTGKSVNGSANVSWTLAEIGAAAAVHQHVLGDITDAGNVATINTNGSTANYLRGDGTWVTPPNTTYSSMTEAEATTGTATTGRVITAAVLKGAITTHAPTPTDVTGNAGTATRLQTARAINGTNFDGSAAITTANWGTARTLTIGSTGKSVNGSANVSWTLAELGAAAASHVHSAADLTSGTLPDARLSGNYTGLGNLVGSTFQGNASDTVTTPAHTWAADTNTGMYRASDTEIGFTINGTKRGGVNNSGWNGVGTNLTELNASNISSGTLGTARLHSSVVRTGTKDNNGSYIWFHRNGVVSYVTRFGSTGNIAEWRYSADDTQADGSSVMTINTSGNLVCTGNVTAYSDARVKTDVEKITDALSKVDRIGGYTFTRTDVEGRPRQTGVIAQEVEKVLPEAVIQQDDGKLSVAYGNMVGLLIEAIKELKSEVEELKGRAYGATS